jgi:hypothetical protein
VELKTWLAGTSAAARTAVALVARLNARLFESWRQRQAV